MHLNQRYSISTQLQIILKCCFNHFNVYITYSLLPLITPFKAGNEYNVYALTYIECTAISNRIVVLLWKQIFSSRFSFTTRYNKKNIRKFKKKKLKQIKQIVECFHDVLVHNFNCLLLHDSLKIFNRNEIMWRNPNVLKKNPCVFGTIYCKTRERNTVAFRFYHANFPQNIVISNFSD